ncbi:MAG TPA: type IX secretion system sortase PorU [Brumimicrobium sp.]|nr:type IX secretion system sortase PorU [Brumimicrobium sp.]
MKYLFGIIYVLLISLPIYSQKEIEIALKWEDVPGSMSINENVYFYPNLQGSVLSGSDFLYLQEFDRGNISTEWLFDVLSFQTAPVDQKTKEFIQMHQIEVEASPVFTLHNNTMAGIPKAVLSLVPFVKVNGDVFKITSIKFNQTTRGVAHQKSNSFANNSVLREGSGEWYKVAVQSDGVHKIDYNFLKSIGVNVNNLNPDHIHIYGNSFGRLPESNAVYRPDDLLKNDILIVGDEDGSFDASDYILFYGKGPHRWEQNGDGFSRDLNIYSTHSAYFININSSEPPARISNADLTTLVPTHHVTDYNAYAIHEQELVSLMRSGQRWYGELFDANLTQNFSLNIPDINPNGAARLRLAGASRKGGTSTYFSVKYGNVTLGNANLNSTVEDNFTRGVFTSNPGVFQPTSSTFSIQVTFNRTSPSNPGYLDFIEVNARSFLRYRNNLHFRDLNSVGVGNVAQFSVQNFPSGGLIWEVTNPTQPKLVNGTVQAGEFNFSVESDSLREFMAFQYGNEKAPIFLNKVEHQNLHGLPQADYLMVVHPKFISQASRLANLHRNNGLTVHVVTTTQVYNEFSGGITDPTGIKFFAKMFYDRAGGDPNFMPKHLLLFGNGTYDPLNRVSNNHYYVPVYETLDSESYTGSIVSDDYFGLLDDSESFLAADFLDITVGRMIAITEGDAVNLVNKVEHYMKNGSNLYASANLDCGECNENNQASTHGDWRLKYTVIADDEDSGTFVTSDLEPASIYTEQNHPEMNAKKIYLDAYTQTTTAGGQRYPDANKEIDRAIESGSLMTCFVGHGSPTSATAERVMTIGQVQGYTNIDRLTLFVSATCEFARIDDSESLSIGEWLALNEVGGAIAMMTTTRAVFISTNSVTTDHFFRNVFAMDDEGKPRTFGEIMLKTKNSVGPEYSNNKRSFMLLGDPALRIALPYNEIVLDSINNVDVNVDKDTIRALSKVRMKGHIQDQYGNKITNYNGVIQPSIYDKPSERKTLGQDANSPVISFQEQVNVLFKGRATVTNGDFEFEFIVPKDINYTYGEGKASFYSWANNDEGGGGYSNNFIIGGIDTTGLNDQEGPEIELYLNDEDFVNGGMTDETPILMVNLFDESGINTVGNGIGHDITLVLNEDTKNAKVLNDYYESDLDTYKSGKLRYQLERLEPGMHTLTFKVWDVNNNSSERRIEFNVQEKKEIALDHLLNYPNPFTTRTEFFFEHNQVCSALETQIEIFTVTGRLVKTINEMVETRGFRTNGIVWDGRDDFGDQLAKGVYVYRVTVVGPDGDKAQEMQKLYLLK